MEELTPKESRELARKMDRPMEPEERDVVVQFARRGDFKGAMKFIDSLPGVETYAN